MSLWQTHPFQEVGLTRGRGCVVWDASGKPYLDMLSGTWCNVLGHGHPRWIRAVRRQVARLSHTGAAFITTEINGALRKLAEILPGQLNRTVFLNTGSEAVELALKMARAATGADGMVVTERGYYGATAYALALSEAGRMAEYLPSFANIYRLPVPDCPHCPVDSPRRCSSRFPCLDPLAQLADRGEAGIAAVLYEPVLGGGIIVPPKGYGARLRALATRCNALLIAEEVTTGMGRTGLWFGFEGERITPDIVVIGKAIGAGLPVSVVVTTEYVEQSCKGALRHIQSHQNDPISGRIAATVISILQEEHLIERSASCGEYLLQGLKQLQAGRTCISNVRGRGLMVGAELRQECREQGGEICRRLLEAGFIVDWHAPTGTFRLFPPFVISTREIDAFLESFADVLGTVGCD
jgi:2,2-dialkylglycine decarboxylase (pyruvate)